MKQYIKYETPSRAEQETVILYDQVSKYFRVTTDIQKDIHRYIDKFDDTKKCRIGKNKRNKITFIDGYINSKDYGIGPTKRWKLNLTSEERKSIRSRLLKTCTNKKD